MKDTNKMYQLQTVIIALIMPIFIISLWFITSNKGMINTHVLASPHNVKEIFFSMLHDGNLKSNLLASIGRVLKGYAIGASLGFLVGALNGLFKTANRAFLAMIAILRPIPPIAMIPFFILWLGIGETSKITIIVIGSFWPMLLNTIQGFQHTDPKLIQLANSFGKNKLTIMTKIVLPAAVPSIFTGLRLSISQAWTCVVTAEMIAASAGVGYMIQYARELVQPDLLLLGIGCIGVIGLFIDLIMMFLEKKIVYWHEMN